MDLSAFPGGDVVAEGLRDLAHGVESVPALLVSLAETRLRALGLSVPPGFPEAEHRLYLKLATEHGDDAHSRYNALLRRLASFERAVECVGW